MKPLKKPSLPHLLMRPFAAVLLLLSAAGAYATDYPTTILQDGPSAYYRFEETNGTTAVDSSTNHVNATYVFNSTATSPLLGEPGIDTNSILFNGGGSDYGYVDVPYSGLIQPMAPDGTNSGPFSAELWVQPTSYPGDWTAPIAIATPIQSVKPNGWNIYVSGVGAGNPAGQSYFYLDMRPSLFQPFGDVLIQFQHWYHLVLTFDGTNAMFYINGVSHGPYNASGFVPDASGTDAQIGSGQMGIGFSPFIGGIDEVAFYTNVLSSTQVTAHYLAGTNSFRAVPTPPGVLSEVASATNYSGLPVTFSVTASGSLPLHYQWYKNSVLTGPDSSSFTFTSVYPADNNDTIQVIITNGYGSATSSVATLTVLTNLNIVSPPGSITRNVGSYAAFHVTADGAVPIKYQWSNSVDGVNFTAIAGATNDTLWLTNVQLSQSGNTYAVDVVNPFTSSSVSASLSVQARTDPSVPLTGYGAIVAADKPVAYYRLDETNGTLAEDAVGSFDGTYTPNLGTVTYGVTTGIPKSTDAAITLAGGATIQIPFAPELNPDTAWSAEMWLNPTSLGANGGDYRVVLSSEYNQFGNALNGWYIYQQPNNTFAFVPQPANAFITAGPDDTANANALVAGKWYHLVLTDDTTNFNMYINGELRTGFPVASLNFIPDGDGINADGTASLGGDDGGNTVIGQRTDAAFGTFLGSVDDVAFYNYALTPRQVLLHSLDAAELKITPAGTNVVLTWPVGVLQVSTNVAGPYTNVLSATSPKTNGVTSHPVFWRVHVP